MTAAPQGATHKGKHGGTTTGGPVHIMHTTKESFSPRVAFNNKKMAYLSAGWF